MAGIQLSKRIIKKVDFSYSYIRLAEPQLYWIPKDYRKAIYITVDLEVNL